MIMTIATIVPTIYFPFVTKEMNSETDKMLGFYAWHFKFQVDVSTNKMEECNKPAAHRLGHCEWRHLPSMMDEAEGATSSSVMRWRRWLVPVIELVRDGVSVCPAWPFILRMSSVSDGDSVTLVTPLDCTQHTCIISVHASCQTTHILLLIMFWLCNNMHVWIIIMISFV